MESDNFVRRIIVALPVKKKNILLRFCVASFNSVMSFLISKSCSLILIRSCSITDCFSAIASIFSRCASSDIAREALKRLATAGSVKGALQGHELRGLALRLANHGELTRLSGLINNLISIGLGRESAFAAAVLGDNALMEKAWQDTGMLAEAVLHAHVFFFLIRSFSFFFI
uniref:Uncharacterized protein n=1 Tax=Brassica campestris TaxID=3711 RepID=M4EH12_BRACM